MKTEKMRMGKRITGVLLSAVMAVSLSGEIVYGSVNETVNEAIGEEVSGNYEITEEYAGAGTNTHTHEWHFDSGSHSEITATCKGKNGNCTAPDFVKLTIKLKKDSENKQRPTVLMNGREQSSGKWGITFQIKYYSTENAFLGSDPPTANGDYKVRAEFGDSSTTYLEIDYLVKHEHVWKYEKVGDDKVRAVCQGTVGTCDVGTEGISFILSSRIYRTSKKRRIAVWFADEDKELLSKNDWGITYQIQYFDSSGKDTGTEAPQTNGINKARVTFGKSGDTGAPYLEKSYKVTHTHTWKYVKSSNNGVKATCQEKEGTCDAGGTSGITLSLDVTKESVYTEDSQEKRVKISADNKNLDLEKIGIKYSLTYRDYTDGEKGTVVYNQEPQNPGTYYVEASFGDSGNVLLADTFIIQSLKKNRGEDDQSEIKVRMGNYDLQGKIPNPRLSEELEDDPEVVFYYSEKDQSEEGIEWDSEKPGAGTYYMYAVIEETSDYNAYTTSTQKFTVYPRHKWSSMPGSLASKAKKIKRSCVYCGKTQNITLPQKTVSVVMGKSVRPASRSCTFALEESAWASKKYISVAKNGRITTKAKPAYYRSLKSYVPVAVKAGGKTYRMTVKLKIPAPEVNINCVKRNQGGQTSYKFQFNYKISRARRVQVRMKEGETAEIVDYLNRNISSPKSTSRSYIILSSHSLRRFNNKVTFTIKAYYGSKKSEVCSRTIRVS